MSMIVTLECGCELTIAGGAKQPQMRHCAVHAAAPEMADAVRLFEKGWGHFLKCCNLKNSYLDAGAIDWMNRVGIKMLASSSVLPKQTEDES